MANVDKVEPDVTIEIGGHEFVVRFSLGAFRRLEKETGKNALKGEVWDDLSADDIVTLLWAAMNSESREQFSADEIGDMIMPADIPDITTKLQAAMEMASPAATASQKKTAKAGEGAKSSKSTG